MSRRGRNKGEKDVSAHIREHLAPAVTRLMVNRHKLMAPLPVPAADIYQLLWADKHRDAFEILEGTGVLRLHRSFKITDVEIGYPSMATGAIRITCDKDVPMARDMTIPMAMIPDSMRELINPWMHEWLRYRDETAKVEQQVNRVGRACSTWGQVVRIWPDLQGFLGEWGKEKVHGAKVKSPYPNAVLYLDGSLEEGFMPEVFEPFSNMLAECLMMPFIDDLYHAGEVLYS